MRLRQNIFSLPVYILTRVHLSLDPAAEAGRGILR